MSLDFRKLLTLPDKGVSLTRDPLAKLFRRALMENQVTIWWADELMKRYLNEPSNHIPNDSGARSSARGNLYKELAADRMTFNVLVKGLKFLNPMSVAFNLTIQWTPSRSTTHTIEMPISRFEPNYNPEKPLELEDVVPEGIMMAIQKDDGSVVVNEIVTKWPGNRKVHHTTITRHVH